MRACSLKGKNTALAQLRCGFESHQVHKKVKGELFERVAEKYLVKKGYKILKRNWRILNKFKKQIGEIDLLAQDGNILVVVEVKGGKEKEEFPLWERIDRKKKRKLKAIVDFLKFEFPDLIIRIDAIFVLNSGAKIKIIHLKNIIS